MTENENLRRQLMIVSNINNNLVTHVTDLEKQHAKMKQ